MATTPRTGIAVFAGCHVLHSRHSATALHLTVRRLPCGAFQMDTENAPSYRPGCQSLTPRRSTPSRCISIGGGATRRCERLALPGQVRARSDVERLALPDSSDETPFSDLVRPCPDSVRSGRQCGSRSQLNFARPPPNPSTLVRRQPRRRRGTGAREAMARGGSAGHMPLSVRSPRQRRPSSAPCGGHIVVSDSA